MPIYWQDHNVRFDVSSKYVLIHSFSLH